MKEEFVVNPKRAVILHRTVENLSVTRGTPPLDPGVRDWVIFFYNSVTLARRIHDTGRGFGLEPNTEHPSSRDKDSNKAECSSTLI